MHGKRARGRYTEETVPLTPPQDLVRRHGNHGAIPPPPPPPWYVTNSLPNLLADGAIDVPGVRPDVQRLRELAGYILWGARRR